MTVRNEIGGMARGGYYFMVLLALGLALLAVGCKGDFVLGSGHGGTTRAPLTRSTIKKESQEVFEVAYILNDLLVANDYEVCMARTTNTETLSDNARYTYANITAARVLISVRRSGSSTADTDYATTLYGRWQEDRKMRMSHWRWSANSRGCWRQSRTIRTG